MARSGSDSAMMGSDFRAAASISWTVIPADSSKRVLARLRSASTVMPANTIACVVITTSTSVRPPSTLTCSWNSWKPIRVTLSTYVSGSRSRKAKKPRSFASVYAVRVESATGWSSASAPSTGRPSSDLIRPLSWSAWANAGRGAVKARSESRIGIPVANRARIVSTSLPGSHPKAWRPRLRRPGGLVPPPNPEPCTNCATKVS